MFKNSFRPNISIFRRILIATFLKREHGPSCIFSELLLEILTEDKQGSFPRSIMRVDLKAKYLGGTVGSALGDAFGEIAFTRPQSKVAQATTMWYMESSKEAP